MQYHDWHLSGYSIRDYGMRIILHLSWDYKNHEKKENHIQFSDVAVYHFIQGMGSIITDIDEQPLASFIQKEESFIRGTAKQIGLSDFNNDLAAYLTLLEKEKFKYWTIDSAIGFEGFVVAKSIKEITEPNLSL
jgi:hypothetical protein